MRIVKWDKALSIGDGDIDEGHKHLMSIINDLYGAMAQGDSHDVVSEILSDLAEYAKDHFLCEERIMDEFGYAHAIEHKKEHADLTDTLTQMLEDFEAGKTPLTLGTIMALKAWLLRHMKDSDLKLVSAVGGRRGVGRLWA